jgi:hypothetical protein
LNLLKGMVWGQATITARFKGKGHFHWHFPNHRLQINQLIY